MRLIVGSANLTRPGFRHNYECVASVDYGGRDPAPRTLLTTAIGLVQQIGAQSQTPQLSRQLAAFAAQALSFQTEPPDLMIPSGWSPRPRSFLQSAIRGGPSQTKLPRRLRLSLPSGRRQYGRRGSV